MGTFIKNLQKKGIGYRVEGVGFKEFLASAP